MSNLLINFVPPSPPCINGYKVKYRKIGDSTYTTLIPNVFTSPAIIPSIDITSGYEGIITSDCSNSIYSSGVSFNFPACTGENKKIVNGVCSTGTKQYISSVANTSPATGYTCTYRYFFADGSQSPSYTEQSPVACI